VTSEGESAPPPQGMGILKQLERKFGPLPPNYVGPIGVRTFCANYPTDEAVERLTWAVEVRS
jgi:hypothetical protein